MAAGLVTKEVISSVAMILTYFSLNIHVSAQKWCTLEMLYITDIVYYTCGVMYL